MSEDDLVEPHNGCPICGERRVDQLVWIDDDNVRCTSCGIVYQPGAGGDAPFSAN